jgi:cysteine desulfurase/selenocysteine lyase
VSTLAHAPLTQASEWPGLVNPDGTRWHYLDTGATAQKPRG